MQDANGRSEEFLGRLHARTSAEAPGEELLISFSEVLGRRVSAGDTADQQIGTLDKIASTLENGDFSGAAELSDFFLDERPSSRPFTSTGSRN